jgi:hypothetical protein
MSVPDNTGLDHYAPGIVEAMKILSQNLEALHAVIVEHGMTAKSARLAAALMRTAADEMQRLADGLPAQRESEE